MIARSLAPGLALALAALMGLSGIAVAQTQVGPMQSGVKLNSSTVGGANAAVAVTITATANAVVRIASISAFCSAGTSTVTITDGGVTTWRGSPGLVTTTILGVAYPVPYTANALGNTVVVTLGACGAGNLGTLNVQADRS